MGLVMPCATVWGQAPAPQSVAPRFEISRYEVNGNTLLTPAEIERAFGPYTGANKDFGDIQRALEALEQTYRNRGFGAVQVLLPEQDITRGVVRLNVSSRASARSSSKATSTSMKLTFARAFLACSPGVA
jgi:hemolysin activation/secretion protein